MLTLKKVEKVPYRLFPFRYFSQQKVTFTPQLKRNYHINYSKYLMPSHRNEFTRCNQEPDTRNQWSLKVLRSSWIINCALFWSAGSGECMNCLRGEEMRSVRIAVLTESEFSLLQKSVSKKMSILKGAFHGVNMIDCQRALRMDAAMQINCTLDQRIKYTVFW